MTKSTSLDIIDHVAVQVSDIAKAVDWYTTKFKCQISYQDDTWAILDFENIKLSLVVPSQHPRHITVERPDAEKFGKLKTHRDGKQSTYIADPFGNSIEVQLKE